MIIPDKVKQSDTIAIIAPATIVKEEYVKGAARVLTNLGFRPKIMPGTLGPACGSFASSFDSRLADLKNALHDPEVKAILCARGGYGAVHLLPYFTDSEIRDNAKWLVGFSDISALHALWHKAGVASIHGPMAKHLSEEGSQDSSSSMLLDMLEGRRTEYTITTDSHPFNVHGVATGRLVGGNLAVLTSLAGTPYDLLDANHEEGVVIFVEDISEAIYAVERMLTRILLSGLKNRVRGLIFGQFTEYRPDRNFPDMESMIHALLSRFGIADIPMTFNFPIGHVKENFPIAEGALYTLRISEENVKLTTKLS